MVRVPAFAKINLGLKVLYKRPDRFHEIATVFQTISLADTISIDARPAQSTFVQTTATVEIPGENLCTRAAHAFLERFGLTAEVNIHIEKVIPMGGGLAGGSTDAGAVLLALPSLLGVAASAEDLHSIAAILGSDLPFFLLGGTAEASGRGEILERLPDVQPLHGVLIAPGLHISTPLAYAGLARPAAAELTGEDRDAIIKKFRVLVRSVHEDQPLAVWADDCENDFEIVAFAQHEVLSSMLKRIEASGARLARMSGSGSTLFGLYDSAEAAQVACEQLKVELSGHATAIRIETFQSISRRQYERAWHTALSSLTDGASWPPRSPVV